MKLTNATVLVTGANRGLGRALVTAALAAGARKVYATARDAAQLADLVAAAPDRVVALALDITDATQLAAAAARAGDIDLLINNAGVLTGFGLLTTSAADLVRDFEVNVFGTLAATRAFVPALERAGTAAVVNVLSIASLANMPALGGYAAAKAASHSITQGLRHELGKKHIAVHAVFPGPIDTDMVRAMAMAKASADDVARAILDGVARGDDEIFPDPVSRELIAMYKRDPSALGRQFIAMSGG
ncbi:MAG TPA: SDR family oxidoreductase [Kofleriaceae bacterium]|nr:SDR family oxidoreductase [Kofleriaceae bacterium]